MADDLLTSSASTSTSGPTEEQLGITPPLDITSTAATSTTVPEETGPEDLPDFQVGQVGDFIINSEEFGVLSSDEAFDVLKSEFSQEELEREDVQQALADEAFKFRRAKGESLTYQDIFEVGEGLGISLNIDPETSSTEEVAEAIELYGDRLEAATKLTLGEDAVKAKREVGFLVDDIKRSVRRDLLPQVGGEDPTGVIEETGERLAKGFLGEFGEKINSERLRLQAEGLGTPEGDEKFGLQVAEGVGQFGADLTTIGGFAAVGAIGGAPGAATGALIGTGVVLAEKTARSIEEAYDAVFRKTGDKGQATEAAFIKAPFSVAEATLDGLVLRGTGRALSGLGKKALGGLTKKETAAAIGNIAAKNPTAATAIERTVRGLTPAAIAAAEEATGAALGEIGQQLAVEGGITDPAQVARQAAIEGAVGAIARGGVDIASTVPDTVQSLRIRQQAEVEAQDINQEAQELVEDAEPLREETRVPEDTGEQVTQVEEEVITPPQEEEVRLEPEAQVEPVQVTEPTAIEEAIETPTEVQPETRVDETASGRQFEFQKQEIPVEQIVVQKDVPNFKQDADPETGVVGEVPTRFSETAGGNIVVLEKQNGELEVISGRNRLAVAKQDPTKQSISAIVIQESENFTKQDATALDAELNIRDNQGEVSDYAKFFENANIPIERARERGLLRNVRGRRGFIIGTQASDSLRSAFFNGRVDERAAAQIAGAAPNNASLQQVGLDQIINKNKTPAEAVNVMQVAEQITEAPPGAQQADLFGEDDTALQNAERLAGVATRLQNEAQQALTQLRRIKQVGKAEVGAIPGVSGEINLDDPAALDAEIARLSDEVKDWRSWATNPELVSRVQQEAGIEVIQPTVAPTEVEPEVTEEVTEAELETEAVIEELAQKIAETGVDDAGIFGAIISLDSLMAQVMREGEVMPPPTQEALNRAVEQNKISQQEADDFLEQMQTPEAFKLFEVLADFVTSRGDTLRAGDTIVGSLVANEGILQNAFILSLELGETPKVLHSPAKPPKKQPTIRGERTPPGKGAPKPKLTPREQLERNDPTVLRTTLPAKMGAPIGDEVFGPGSVPENVNRDPEADFPKTKKVKGISAPEVIDSLADVLKSTGLDTPIREATLKSRKYLGVFKVLPEVIRTRVANDIPTAAHEVAHAIEKAIYGRKPNPWVGKRANTFRKELSKLGKDLYGDTKPNGGYFREGWAEFFRFYITGEKDTAKIAPNTHKWFENTFLKENPETAKAIENAREKADRYFSQTPLQRAKHAIVEAANLTQRLRALIKPEVRQGIKDKTVKNWIEWGDILHQLETTAAEKAGRELKFAAETPFQTFQALRMTSGPIVSHMVEDGMIDFAGNQVGPSLKEALGIIGKKRQEDFTIYLWAKRAIALWTDPLRPGGRDPGLSLDDAVSIVAELENSDFQIAAGKVYNWADGVLNYIGQASPEFQGTVDKIRSVDPGFYIPLQREFNALDNIWLKEKSKQGSPFKRLKGSGRRIKNPIDSLIVNAEAMVSAAHKRNVVDQVLRLSRSVEGLGHLIDQVPRQQVPVATQSMADLINSTKREIEKRGIEGVSIDLEIDEDVISEQDAKDLLSNEMLTLFAPTTKTPNGESSYIMVTENGKTKFYEVDSRLAEALQGMDVYRMGKLADMLLGAPARWFRLGTTGLRASFSLVTNPARDFRTFTVNTQSDASLPALTSTFIASLMESGANAVSGGKYTTPTIEMAKRLGGQMATPLGQDTNSLKRTRDNLFKSGFQRVVDPRNWTDFARELLQFPENAARIAEIKLISKQIGYTPGNPMTEAQAQQFLLAFKQVTTDFTAAGKFARIANQAVPFFNAQIQGPRAHVRAAKRNPGQFALRMAQGAAFAAAMWWRNKDEDWWEEMPADLRYLYTWVPFTNPLTGNKEMARIPRAFEVDGLSMALVEATLDSLWTQNPEQVTQWFDTFIGTTTPSPTPVLVKELFQQIYGPGGYDFFWERPIVPLGEALNQPPEEQFNEFTSETAKVLASAFVDVLPGDSKRFASPRRIDHAIRSIFGPVASDIIDGAESLLGLEDDVLSKKEQGLRDLPVVGVLFSSSGQFPNNPKSIDKFYEAYGDAKLANKRAEKGDPEKEVFKVMEDARKSLTALSLIRRDIPEFNERQDLKRLQVDIAKEALEIFESGSTPSDFQRFRRRRKQLEKEAGK